MAKAKDKKPKKVPPVNAGGGKTPRAAGEAEKKKPAEVPKKEPSVSDEELASLRGPVEEAKAKLEAGRKEADTLEAKAKAILAESKEAYRVALAPYREACRKVGATCEFEGGRSGNVSAKVSFVVEKVDKGVRIAIKGRPDTEEMIPFAVLKESVQKAAYRFTDAHLGPREEIGNKGGSLYNRLRAVMS